MRFDCAKLKEVNEMSDSRTEAAFEERLKEEALRIQGIEYAKNAKNVIPDTVFFTGGAPKTVEPDVIENPIIWIDIETTGLSPTTDKMLEISVVVTDSNLKVHRLRNFLVSPEISEDTPMPEQVRKMHTANGLWLERAAAKDIGNILSVGHAEQIIFGEVLHKIIKGCPLGGSSPHFDRAFLKTYMPNLEEFLGYRNIDVSTIRDLVNRWKPEHKVEKILSYLSKHRALLDILDSIDELKVYRETIFK